MLLLDLLFPKYCINCRKIGDYICAECFSLLNFASGKKGGEGRIDGFFFALASTWLSIKIHKAFKERNLSSLKELIGSLMYESLIQNEEFMKIKGNLILVPMPIGKLSFRKRGQNESLLIAKELSKRLNIEILDSLSYRRGKIVGGGRKSDGLTILLVEDVPNKFRLEEAARLLKKQGAGTVFGVSFISYQKTSPKR